MIVIRSHMKENKNRHRLYNLLKLSLSKWKAGFNFLYLTIKSDFLIVFERASKVPKNIDSFLLIPTG